jgi:hypothetical protein
MSKWRVLSPDEYSDNNEFIEDEFGTYSPNLLSKNTHQHWKKIFFKKGFI